MIQSPSQSSAPVNLNFVPIVHASRHKQLSLVFSEKEIERYMPTTSEVQSRPYVNQNQQKTSYVLKVC